MSLSVTSMIRDTDDSLKESQEDIDDSKVLEITDYIIGLDARSSIGIYLDDAEQFAIDITRRDGLWYAFITLSHSDQINVVQTYADSIGSIFDLRGVILFLQTFPESQIITDEGHGLIGEVNPCKIREKYCLYGNKFDNLPDHLLLKLYSFNRHWLFEDITAAWIACNFAHVHGPEPLSDILDRASLQNTSLSSTLFVKLMTDWENLQHYPLDWSIQMVNTIRS